MDRIKEMKDFLHDTEEILVKERIDKIKMICMREENIKKEIQTIVDKLTMGKAGGCVAISFLRSSVVESNMGEENNKNNVVANNQRDIQQSISIMVEEILIILIKLI